MGRKNLESIYYVRKLEQMTHLIVEFTDTMIKFNNCSFCIQNTVIVCLVVMCKPSFNSYIKNGVESWRYEKDVMFVLLMYQLTALKR